MNTLSRTAFLSGALALTIASGCVAAFGFEDGVEAAEPVGPAPAVIRRIDPPFAHPVRKKPIYA